MVFPMFPIIVDILSDTFSVYTMGEYNPLGHKEESWRRPRQVTETRGKDLCQMLLMMTLVYHWRILEVVYPLDTLLVGTGVCLCPQEWSRFLLLNIYYLLHEVGVLLVFLVTGFSVCSLSSEAAVLVSSRGGNMQAVIRFLWSQCPSFPSYMERAVYTGRSECLAQRVWFPSIGQFMRTC